jgi:adenylate cyclase
MTPVYLDPAPRAYPEFVHLLARSSRGEASAQGTKSFADLEDWLLSDAINEPSMLELAESLAWRMVGAGIPIKRATIHAGTLHPQLAGFAWGWQASDGLCDEIVVKAVSTQTDAFLKSPIRKPIEDGVAMFLDARNSDHCRDYPIIAELAEDGITSYAALPLPKRIGANRYDVVTIATDEPQGFSKQQQAQLGRILRILALHVHRHVARRIAENVLNVYLGYGAGRQVLDGTIERGAGNAMTAVVWFADMRNFTALSETLQPSSVNLLLNGFLDQLVSAVNAHGGDVLKFMGDGILAVFPFDDETGAGVAANAAMSAADDALNNLERFNKSPPPEVAAIANRTPLRCGIAMHQGEVFFGNVGGQDRLDFTVIGRSVNEAARLEQLTKRLMRPILISQDVARHLTCPVDDCGEQELKGFARPVRVFAPKHWKSSAIVL